MQNDFRFLGVVSIAVSLTVSSVAILGGCSSPPKRLSNAVMLVRTFKPPITDQSKSHSWSMSLTENHTASLSNYGSWGEGDALIPSLNAKIGDRFSIGGSGILGKASTSFIDRTFSGGLGLNAELQVCAGETLAMYLTGSATWMTATDSEKGNANVKWEKDPATGSSWTPTEPWTATSTIKLYEQQLGLIGRYSLSPGVRLFVGPAMYHTSFYSKNSVTGLATIEQRFNRWNPAAHVLLDFEAGSGAALFLGGTYVQMQSLGPESEFQKKTVTVTAGIDLRF